MSGGQGAVLALGLFDLETLRPAEQAARVSSMARLLQQVHYPLRLIVRAAPANLEAAVAAAEATERGAPPALRAAAQSYRRHLAGAATDAELRLRDVAAHLVAWPPAQTSPASLAGMLRSGFGTAAQVVDHLPPLLEGEYTEAGRAGDRLEPTAAWDGQPFLRVLIGYELRGIWLPETLLSLFAEVATPWALSIDVATLDPQAARGKIKRARGGLNVQQQQQEQGPEDVQTGDAVDAGTRAARAVQRGQAWHEVALLLLLSGGTVAELDAAEHQVRTAVGSAVAWRRARGVQAAGLAYFTAARASGLGPAVPRWPVLSEGLPMHFPLGRPVRSVQEGLLLGVEWRRFLVFVQGWYQANGRSPKANHEVVIGKTGFGKTVYLRTARGLREVLAGVQVFFIDNQGHGAGLAGLLGPQGVVYNINFEDWRMNPLDFYEETLTDQIDYVIGQLEELILARKSVPEGGPPTAEVFDEEETGALDRALQALYKGAQPDARWEHLAAGRTPILADLCQELEAHGPGGEKAARRLRNLLVDSSVGQNFNCRTEQPWDFRAYSVVSFNLGGVSKRYMRYGYRLTLGSVRRYARFVKAREQKVRLVIDEAHFLLDRPESAKQLEYMVREWRTWWTALTLATQDFRPFTTAVGQTILRQVSQRVFFRLDSGAEQDAAALVPELTAGHITQLQNTEIGETVMQLDKALYYVTVDLTRYELEHLANS